MNQIQEKRVAVVTGGNGGLGIELCRQLAQRGYSVILTARKKESATRTISKLQKEGLDVTLKLIDVKKSLLIGHVVDYVQKNYCKLYFGC